MGIDLIEKQNLNIFKKPLDNPVTAMGILFPNPVGLAAGFDKNGAHVKGLSKIGFGFLEIGTVTPIAQPGNPKPRLLRIKKNSAIINRMGFNNHGIDNLINNIKAISEKSLPIGINIGANKDSHDFQRIKDYLLCFERAYAHSDYIVFNISSPNTKGLRTLQGLENLNQMLGAITAKKEELRLKHKKLIPLVIKISPDLDEKEIIDIVQLCLEFKVNGIIATNTTISRDSIDKKYLSESGGLSGRPLLKKSLKVVSVIKSIATENITIIGCGGILSKDDALEFKKLGADLLQIYSGFIYRGSKLLNEINQNWKI